MHLFAPKFAVVLLIEFVGLFVVIPASAFYFRTEISTILLPTIVLISITCIAYLIADRQFKRKKLLNHHKFSRVKKHIIGAFVIQAIICAAIVMLFMPEQLFSLPTSQPFLWLSIVAIYPFFSALPQELIFRTFIFHRYKAIFPKKRHRKLASAICFGFAHIIYNNWVAMLLSTLAGYYFAHAYSKYKSTVLVALEHSLWGIWLFTVGLGGFFESSLIY